MSSEERSVSDTLGTSKDVRWQHLETTWLANHHIVTASRAQLTAAMRADCIAARSSGVKGPPRLVFDVNGHGISMAANDLQYRQLMCEADIIHADGGFLVTLSRLFTRRPIAERSATTDLFHDFAAECVQHRLSVFLLGGIEAVNSECAESMAKKYPGLIIAGRRHGYFDISEELSIVEEINKCSPDVLWVGLGKPNEQSFSVRWRHALSARWVVTCGGCFNYVTGHYQRAPKWMQAANVEWIHRALSNPRHLLWRYLTTSPHALWIAAASIFKGQGRGRDSIEKQ